MRGQQTQKAEEVTRPRRTPLNKRDLLSIKGKEPGYQYRIVNDVGDRIEDLIERGYEVVKAEDVRIGDKRVNAAKPLGSVAQVSVGGGVKAVVMRQKYEWFQEDQAAKEAERAALENSMKQQVKAQDGVFEQKNNFPSSN